MTHGAPDNFQVQPRNIVYVLQDDAELAVRLGAVSSIDRLGNVLFFDDFSNGKEAWYTLISGTGAAVAISAGRYRHGGFSLKLTGGSNSARFAMCQAVLTYPDPSKMGVECNISFNNEADSIQTKIYLYSGSAVYSCIIKIDITNNKLQLYDRNNTWQDIATSLNLLASDYNFHSLKAVGDFVNGNYIRVILDGVSYDISSHLLGYEVSTTNPQLTVHVVNGSKSGYNGIAYLDSVIITRNEP